MKILVLEHPRIKSEENFNDIAHTPLWSCILGPYAVSSLRSAGYNTDYLDKSDSSNFDGLVEELYKYDDLIRVNTVYMWEHTGKLFAFFDKLRSNRFTGHLNLFGFYPTLAFEAIINYSTSVSSVSAGECEYTLIELAEVLSRNGDFSQTPGIVSLKNSSINYTIRQPGNNPDVFSFPVRNLLKRKNCCYPREPRLL